MQKNTIKEDVARLEGILDARVMSNSVKSIPKYSPAPWNIVDIGSELYVMQGRPASNICRVDNYNKYANAHLIAAAPDLYAALKVSLDMLNQLLKAAEMGLVPDISIGFFKNRTQIIEPALALVEKKE